MEDKLKRTAELIEEEAKLSEEDLDKIAGAGNSNPTYPMNSKDFQKYAELIGK